MEVAVENTLRYDKYKDSGVEWLGKIPEHWELKRFKFLAQANKGKLPNKIVSSNNDNLPPYLSMEYLRGGEENQWVLDKTALVIGEGEVLLLWDGSNSGEFLMSRKGVISSTVAHIVFKGINQKYAWYHSKVLEIELRENTIGMGIPHVNGRLLNSLMLCLPSLQEQTAIAHFLDDKTAKIDDAIAIKERQIELLKERKQILVYKAVTRGLDDTVILKDSGVEWIGEIPEHWIITKLKHTCLFILDGTHGSFPRVTSGYRLLSVRNIIKNKFVLREDDSMVSHRHFKEISSKFLIKNGDIQLAIVGATLGKVALVEDLENYIVTQRSLSTIRVNDKIINLYLFYYLQSSLFQSFLWNNAGFSAQPGIYLGTIQNSHIPLPNLLEQKQISEYIEAASQKIETAISLKQQEIEKLKEYKSTLINSAVTGKIKVTSFKDNSTRIEA